MGTSNTRYNLEDKIARYLGERDRLIQEIITISAGIDVLALNRPGFAGGHGL